MFGVAWRAMGVLAHGLLGSQPSFSTALYNPVTPHECMPAASRTPDGPKRTTAGPACHRNLSQGRCERMYCLVFSVSLSLLLVAHLGRCALLVRVHFCDLLGDAGRELGAVLVTGHTQLLGDGVVVEVTAL